MSKENFQKDILSKNSNPKYKFYRMKIQSIGVDHSPVDMEVGQMIIQALELRKQFIWYPTYKLSDIQKKNPSIDEVEMFKEIIPKKHSVLKNIQKLSFKMIEGVARVWEGEAGIHGRILFTSPSREEFTDALSTIMTIMSDGPCKTFCHQRLNILEARFNLHQMMNIELESAEQKSCQHRDFYNVRKIDNLIKSSACMNQKHLLAFIKRKLRKEGNTKVTSTGITLKEVFDELELTPHDLNVDALGMRADETFHRFDKFYSKNKPIGNSYLRDTFLKYDNCIQGKFLAEITKEVIGELENNRYQFAELRLVMYGKRDNEWDILSKWVVDNQLFSNNVRWLIQIPRLFKVHKMKKDLDCFQDMLNNIFLPLFKVSIDPSSNPKLDMLLQQVVGFDVVDDRSQRESPLRYLPLPKQWNMEENPPYSMFSYYIYANILILNKLRFYLGLSTFTYRPHAGEIGNCEDLAASFLIANSVNHGISLKKNPTLQYLYYLTQIGISMSPLSNNLLWITYDKNPFPRFFARGLNVSLSTDDPLLIHVTREPLVEEYSVAAQVWKFRAVDKCEIARNSVLQSGFEHRFKLRWLGSKYYVRNENDIKKTNVPNIRVQFRSELLMDELELLSQLACTVVEDEIIGKVQIRIHKSL